MERRCIAQKVLGGVGVGMEHKSRIIDCSRLLGTIAKEVVKIGVDTEQHLFGRGGYHRDQNLLTLRQIGACRHRNFEAHIGVTEVVENTSPEGDIFIPFDVYSHQTLRAEIGQRLRQRLI